jgi:hypothetical protein
VINTSSIFGAFNARWLTPEDVARSFVPTTHFKALAKFQHSLLMGPRGCGKTTLLKMLTRPAQTVWARERVALVPQLAEYPSPDFEAIYLPSDIRWSYELKSVSAEFASGGPLAEIVQRASVSISTLSEATRAFQMILDDSERKPEALLKAIITHFRLGPTVPSFREVRLRLLSWMEEIHSRIVLQDLNRLSEFIKALPPALIGHALDTVIRACRLFEEYTDNLAPKKWALCFDELEIAPTWLQQEVIGALRSFDQHFLLKLTWSPLLPTDLTKHQEQQHDYATIRMWHAHASDARPFAQQFITRRLRDRLGNTTVTPREVFGVSPFAQEDGEGDKGYGRGSVIWQSMVDLAAKDPGFRHYLADHGIDPTDPITDSVRLRDETLRKVKPIALLRDVYLKGDTGVLLGRSRKNPPLYYGEDAIYAMSEGNPRLLAGLLNELVDADPQSIGSSTPRIRDEVQAKVLIGASQRMRTGIRTYPVPTGTNAASLSRLIDSLGDYLRAELLGPRFNPDPVGSFFVDQDVPADVVEAIRLGLLIGAFVHVGSSVSDIPISVVAALSESQADRLNNSSKDDSLQSAVNVLYAVGNFLNADCNAQRR